MIKPYYSEPNITIYNGDCLEVMKEFDDNSIDHVLIDPPYGKYKSFENDNLNDVLLYAFLKKISKQLHRICKFNLCIDTAKDKLPLFLRAFENFNYEYPVILHETNGMRNGKVGFNNYGLILWFTKEKTKINRYRDVFSEPIISNKKDFSHPSPKNIKHYSRVVAMFSNKNDIVLDCFLGSGTTAVACKDLGRKCIGIEISKKYCDIAIKRLAQEVFNFD